VTFESKEIVYLGSFLGPRGHETIYNQKIVAVLPGCEQPYLMIRIHHLDSNHFPTVCVCKEVPEDIGTLLYLTSHNISHRQFHLMVGSNIRYKMLKQKKIKTLCLDL